ncbi:hypothetical protein ISCGN_029833 [Ixodes scapularis]
MGHRKPRNTLKKLMLSTQATVKDLIGDIRDTFYPDETQTMAQQLPTAETRLDREVQTAQESEEIKGIDSDFTDAELQTALFQLKRNTAPGPDKITYGMLRNIPDNKLDELLRHINEVWATGELPEEWKEAHVIMLPKRGKLPNTPANLRPISKTSCMGKLMEKMALNRLEWHLEATNQLAHTLVGFRKHVSAQDVAKMIKEQVYDNPSTVQQRTIVAVDLKRAFDNVTHEAILRNLRETNPGNRMCRYVKNFLKDRTVRILDPEGQPSEPFIREPSSSPPLQTLATTSMSLLLFVANALLCLPLASSSQSWPELNPALGKYQDSGKCFPLTEPWYIVFRNYESDPLFGGKAKCIRFTETGPPINGEYPLFSEYGNQSSNSMARLHSSDGYTTRNVINYTSVGGDISIELYVVYFECSACLIQRQTYISGK